MNRDQFKILLVQPAMCQGKWRRLLVEIITAPVIAAAVILNAFWEYVS